MFDEIRSGAAYPSGCVACVVAFVGFVVAVNIMPAGYAVGGAFVFLLGWGYLDQRGRTTQMRQFAARTGFACIGSALPKSLAWQNASPRRNAHSARGAIAGEKGKREFVVFDCTVGHGKGSRSRTVLAVLGRLDNLGAAQFGPDHVAQVGEWAVLLSSAGLLPIEEIEELLSDIR